MTKLDVIPLKHWHGESASAFRVNAGDRKFSFVPWIGLSSCELNGLDSPKWKLRVRDYATIQIDENCMDVYLTSSLKMSRLKLREWKYLRAHRTFYQNDQILPLSRGARNVSVVHGCEGLIKENLSHGRDTRNTRQNRHETRSRRSLRADRVGKHSFAACTLLTVFGLF